MIFFLCIYLFCIYASSQRPTSPAGIVRLVGERASYPEQEIVVSTIACPKDLFVLVFYVGIELKDDDDLTERLALLGLWLGRRWCSQQKASLGC